MSFGKNKDDSKEGIDRVNLSNVIRPNTSGYDAILGKGSKVVGVLQFSGPVELDGEVEGEVIASDRLSIGEAAVLKAKVQGTEVLVKGTIHGDIIATKALILKKPAKIFGNISSPSLSIEDGVLFEGKCTMLSTAHGASSAGHSSTIVHTPSKPSDIRVTEKAV